MEDHCDHHHCCDSHIVIKEVVAHLPYAIFSVAFALVILSFVSFFLYTQGNSSEAYHGTKDIIP